MNSSISVTHQIIRAPAGNPLQKHPDNIKSGSWRRITVAWIQEGQSRPYTDSVYEADICFEGGSRSTEKGYDLGFGSKPGQPHVKDIAKILVRAFEDEPSCWASARLESISKIEEGDLYSIWRVKIVQPYTD